ncbi:hypothetical protein HETIRDRAFT_408782, partial [Heterobasidion irregulare TC 32-1]
MLPLKNVHAEGLGDTGEECRVDDGGASAAASPPCRSSASHVMREAPRPIPLIQQPRVDGGVTPGEGKAGQCARMRMRMWQRRPGRGGRRVC